MPLWGAVALFLLCAVGTALSWRAYLLRGNIAFLCAGVALLTLCLASFFYVTAALWFVWSIN